MEMINEHNSHSSELLLLLTFLMNLLLKKNNPEEEGCKMQELKFTLRFISLNQMMQKERIA
jgi:hypothetical protein